MGDLVTVSRCHSGSAHLVSTGHLVRHVLEATHHPLVPEVVGKRLRPLSQQLHQLGRHLAEPDLGDDE